MEWIIKTAYEQNDRVWMPDGNGGWKEGRVRKIILFMADITESPEKAAYNALNYHCEDIEGNKYVYHEKDIRKRTGQNPGQ